MSPAARPPGRRLFLKQTLFTSLVFAMGSAGALASPTRRATLEVTLHALTLDELEILSAWLDRLVPASADRPGAIALGIPAKFDVEVAAWSAQHQADFKQLLWLFENAGLLLAGFPGKFTSWNAATQDRYLENWMTSGLQIKKEGFLVVKLIGHFLYYCQDASWPMTGYPGPFDPRFRRPAYDAIENQGA